MKFFSTMKSFSCFFLLFVLFTQQALALERYIQLNLTNVTGPESIEFDCKGEGPYVGVSDGRILRWKEIENCWEEFAITSPFRNRKLCDGSTEPDLEPICGRPLGLKFNPRTCHLYIADAYFGLLVVGPYGGVARTLATSAQGIPFKFTNGLDVSSNTEMVYFTDSSTIYQRKDVLSLANKTSDTTGRFLKYNPYINKVDVLYQGLTFPNGVALSVDNSFALVVETNTRRILKFNLETEDGIIAPEEFAKVSLIPDNIKKNDKGEFWVSMGEKLGEDGKVLKVLDRNRVANGDANFTSSEINEFKDKLYIGSVTNSYVLVLNTF